MPVKYKYGCQYVTSICIISNNGENNGADEIDSVTSTPDLFPAFVIVVMYTE